MVDSANHTRFENKKHEEGQAERCHDQIDDASFFNQDIWIRTTNRITKLFLDSE